jgi:hypothetical protein
MSMTAAAKLRPVTGCTAKPAHSIDLLAAIPESAR